MKKKLLTLLFYIFSLLLFAQVPDWQWAVQAGGSSSDSGSGIAIDDNGNSYVTGSFYYSAVFGSYSLNSNGEGDIFVAKMDGDGNWLWATKAGGSGMDSGLEIAIDDNGNSFVTGSFRETATFGSYSLTSYGISDIFVAKIDGDGNWLWVVQAGGSSDDNGLDIAIDNNGNSYLTGSFRETATFGSYSLTHIGWTDIFVAKIDGDGNWLWATKAGGSDYDRGLQIAIDDNGNSYVAGRFQTTAIFGSYYLITNGSYDIFVAKMDGDGNWLWATKAGGSSLDAAYGLVIDNNGNSYVTGSFMETATFGSYFSLSSNGSYDIFVAKMNGAGNWLWVTNAGGSDYDRGLDIAIDDNDNSYIIGRFQTTATFGSYSLTSYGEWDIVVAKVDGAGNWLWASKAGGSGLDHGRSIAIDDNGNSYVTGSFNETATFGFCSLTSSGSRDIFVAKLSCSVFAENEIIPTELGLSNYPNPFNPTTTISFSIPEDSKVELSIYNIKGQKIKSLLNNQITAGEHSIIWNGEDASGEKVSSGVYLYKLNVNGKIEAVKKCLLLK